MTYVLRYAGSIDWKRFQKLPATDKQRIRDAIEKKLAVDPVQFGKPLRTSLLGCRSLRVGSYRIIYRIDKNIVEILLFGHRSTVYSEMEKVL